MTLYLGIDPGLDGACALLGDDGRPPTVIDTPTLNVGKGKQVRRVVDVATLAAVARAVHTDQPHDCHVHAALEAVHSMPGQGVRSMFSMGTSYGIWLGILAALRIPYDLVPPQRWKAAMLDGMGKDKDASRLRALQLFPAMADQLSRKKDDGRAEALLLAEFLRRTAGRGVREEA